MLKFNIIIVVFIRIVIVFFKYNTFYFTHPPRKHDFHIFASCLLFIAESRKYHPVVVLLHNHKWLKNISTKFHQVLKKCSVFYLRYSVLRYFVKYGAIAMARRFFAR